SIQEMLTGQRLCHSESHNDSVLAALNQQRSDGILCDVTLIAEEQKFHAHKAVLAACSDYFRAMFSLCMVESGADEVSLHGVTSLGLKQALEFAYTGQGEDVTCSHSPFHRKQSADLTDKNHMPNGIFMAS
ncbi:KLH32 protein, partial [Crocuta crocuta]